VREAGRSPPDDIGFPSGDVILDDFRVNSALSTVTALAIEGEAGYSDPWIMGAFGICADPPAGLERVSATSPFDSSNKSVTAPCPAGKRVLGTGAEINAGSGEVVLDDVRPNPGLTAVTVQALEDGTGKAGGWSVTATAICADPVDGLERVTATGALGSPDPGVFLPASCPAGKQLTGVGYDVNAGGGQVVVSTVLPRTDLDAVEIRGFEDPDVRPDGTRGPGGNDGQLGPDRLRHLRHSAGGAGAGLRQQPLELVQQERDGHLSRGKDGPRDRR